MAYTKHILLGKITKVHSYVGAVTIKLERYIAGIPEMESVFIETDGRPVPFFITASEQPDNATLRLQFSGYESDEKMKEFVGCKVYLTSPDIQPSYSDEPESLIGYQVCSEKKVMMGTIREIIPQPGHLLLDIRTVKGKNLLLPLHEDLIKKVDKRNKIIEMIIPDGIGEIN